MERKSLRELKKILKERKELLENEGFCFAGISKVEENN